MGERKESKLYAKKNYLFEKIKHDLLEKMKLIFFEKNKIDSLKKIKCPF